MIRIAVPTNRPENVINYLNALTGLGARGEAGRDFDPSGFDGLLLPGGCDIAPSRYGQEKTAEGTVDDELDAIQFAALERFLAAGKPVFGICRGHQLLNVAFGGTLIQHLAGAEHHTGLPGGGDNAHGATIEQGSYLQPIYGDACRVNSSHHQGVDRLGEGLRAVMRAEDGTIEAMEHTTLPVWSVQWHPERMCFAHRREDTADGSLVIRFFLEQCLQQKRG